MAGSAIGYILVMYLKLVTVQSLDSTSYHTSFTSFFCCVVLFVGLMSYTSLESGCRKDFH